MLGHVAHAVRSHDHRAGDDRVQTLLRRRWVDAKEVRQVVTHLVHHVVRLVAVERPVARVIRGELDVARRSRRHVHRGLRPPGRLRNRPGVGSGDVEGMPVNVDRVRVHGQVRQADTHAIAGADEHRLGTGKDAAVHREGVEVEHDRRIGRGRPRLDEPLVEEDREVAVDATHARVARMDDEEPVHPQRDLRHLVEMRVVHERPGLLECELVREGLAGQDFRLIETAHAVHAVRQNEAVPVHRRPLGQFVRDEEAHAVAFECLDRRARCDAVVAPAVDVETVDEFASYRFGDEMKLFDAAHHPERQRRAVRRDDRRAAAAPACQQRFRRWTALTGGSQDFRLGAVAAEKPRDGAGDAGEKQVTSCKRHD